MKTVFVSSTFRDMQFERDAIREITAPLVNAQARRHNDAFDFCDLRWGINTLSLSAEESSRKVLDVCLDVIDYCAPPMVVILGERYGWVPPLSLLRAAAAGKRIPLKDTACSVNALEIEYGALRDPERAKNTLFYFRETEGDVPAEYRASDATDLKRMNALKKRIRETPGSRVKTYRVRWNGKGFDGIREFAETVASDIAAFMRPAWEKTDALSPFDRDRLQQWTFIEEKAGMFRARRTDADALMNLAVRRPVTIVKGDVGSGKSTLFSYLAGRLVKNGWEVLPFVSGLTAGSNSAEDILQGTVYWLEGRLGVPHLKEADGRGGAAPQQSVPALQQRLDLLCRRFAKTGGRLMLMIDAADQLAPTEARDRMAFLPFTTNENIHFFMTCTPGFPTPGRQTYDLGPIGEGDKHAVIAGALSAGHELPPSVVKQMLGMPAANSPLYLSLLVQRLQMMDQTDYDAIGRAGGGMKAIEARQLALLKNNCPGDLDGMSAALLSEVGQRVNPAMAQKAAEYLAVSRHGLRRQDLAALLGKNWTELDFAHFVNLMPDCFLQLDDGRFDFTHKSIRAGFLKKCRDVPGRNRQILAYLKQLDPGDPVRVSEIAYHTIGADDRRFFTEYITEYYTSRRAYVEQAAKDLHAQCLADGGAWIVNLLKSLQYTFATDTLLRFVNNVFFGVFSGSQKELELQLPIAEAALEYGETLYASFRVPKNARVLIECCFGGAKLREKLGDKKSMEQALRLGKRAAALSESLLRAQDTPENRRLYARCCRLCGRLCEETGSREALTGALEYYQQSYTLCEQLLKERDCPENRMDHAHCCGLVGGIFEALGREGDAEKALSYYEKELQACLQLDEAKKTDGSRKMLANSYVHVAGVHQRIGGRTHLQLALELYKENLALISRIEKERFTAANRRELSVAYDLLGDVYEEMGGEEAQKRALQYYRRSMKLCEQLATELGTAESRRDLSVSLLRVADLLAERGSKRDLEQAIELCRRDVEISEQLEKELKTNESRRDLAVSLTNAAGLYLRRGEKEDLSTAQKYYRRGVTLREQLAGARRTAASLHDLSQTYLRYSEVCRLLSGEQNLGRAKELSEKNLALAEAFAAEYKTVQSYQDLVLALYSRAEQEGVSAAARRKYLQRALKYAQALCKKSPENEAFRDLLEAVTEELQ